MLRDIEAGRGVGVHEAMTMGATWSEVAAALDITPNDAAPCCARGRPGRTTCTRATSKQAVSSRSGWTDGDQHAAVIALCELVDEETASVVTR
ncbi:hypothetical protein ACFQ7G_24865 [Streptomyces massasporeus]